MSRFQDEWIAPCVPFVLRYRKMNGVPSMWKMVVDQHKPAILQPNNVDSGIRVWKLSATRCIMSGLHHLRTKQRSGQFDL